MFGNPMVHPTRSCAVRTRRQAWRSLAVSFFRPLVGLMALVVAFAGPVSLGDAAHAAVSDGAGAATLAAGQLSIAGQIKVLTLNTNGAQDTMGVPWTIRAQRLANWMQRSGAVPDVIVLQELWGWLFTGPRDCGLGLGKSVGDYDQIDRLLYELKRVSGVTFRVAYMTGREGNFGFPSCGVYHAQAMLYNPLRLRNDTQSAAGSQPHDSPLTATHLRRSLPLCNRGTNLMPLNSLIDGPAQMDKCNRPTPSGPAWAVWAPSGGHIIGSAVRFTILSTAGSVTIINLHPNSGAGATEASTMSQFVSKVSARSAGGPLRYYPPIIAADHNEVDVPRDLDFARVTPELIDDPVGIFAGRTARFPALRALGVGRVLVAPVLIDGNNCPISTSTLVSDHCAVFAEFDPGASGRLPDGNFLRTPNGDLFRIAGGAPLWLSDYSTYDECTPTCTMVDEPDLLGLLQYPANGTILRARETGHLYKVAGGAPIYLTNCQDPGVCVGSGITVNQRTIDTLGDRLGNKHLRQYPVDGTILDARDRNDPKGGRPYTVAGGAPLYLPACDPASVCQGTGGATVNLGSVQVLGADPRPGAAKHLRQFPVDSTILDAKDPANANGGRLYKVAGGAPLYLTSCAPAEVCAGSASATVTQGTIDVLGDPTNDKHLRAVPADGTLLRAAENGRLYVTAGGAPLYPANPCNGEICFPPVVINQGTVDLLDHMRDLAPFGATVQTRSNQKWRLTRSITQPELSWRPTTQSGLLVEDSFAQAFGQVNPVGSIDTGALAGPRMRVQGWALDPNSVGKIDVRVSVDGALALTAPATVNRPDLRAFYSAYGNRHGYDFTVAVPLTQGGHSVCVTAVNVGVGVDVQLGCRRYLVL